MKKGRSQRGRREGAKEGVKERKRERGNEACRQGLVTLPGMTSEHATTSNERWKDGREERKEERRGTKEVTKHADRA